MELPRRLMAGVTLKWDETLSDYSAADGWTLKYALRHPSNAKIDLASTASGAAFSFSVASTTTAAWAAGTYTWRAYVERAGERFEVGAGEIVIEPDFAAANTLDGRTLARKALDDARAALAAWTPTRKRYQIGDRQMEFNDTAEIIKTIAYWEAEVAKEDVLAGRRRELGRRIMSRL